MFNVCLFGDSKAKSAPPVSVRMPSESDALLDRVRRFLLRPDIFRSMSQLLSQFDRDGDSKISPFEFDAALRKLGFSIEEGERQLLIDSIDKDQDGLISYAELFTYLQSSPGKLKRRPTSKVLFPVA